MGHWRRIPVLVALILALVTLAPAQPALLSPVEAADGWILLFDGETLFGWTPEGGARWRVENGILVADSGDAGWLRSNSAFADFILVCEFRTGAEGNSGIFLRSARPEAGPPHETGYELQIWNQHPQYPTGSLVNHAAAKGARFLPDQWNQYEVRAEGTHWVVKLNGKQVLETWDQKSLAGYIGLQYNPGRKIEFRNIKLKPLNLRPLFNGRDLTGWRRVDTPRAKESPVWEARDGMIHVEKGPGHLETEEQFQDFILQLDVRTNPRAPGHHPNSGVFFRGQPGVLWSGYEAQIRNEYEDEDPTRVVDFGTGGIYRNQPARRIVARDGEFFTMTIAAHGRHMAVWVNGYPVSDWEDPHPEGTNVRKQEAVLSAGTISLQAHDPTTNLDFKNIRIAPLPARLGRKTD